MDKNMTGTSTDYLYETISIINNLGRSNIIHHFGGAWFMSNIRKTSNTQKTLLISFFTNIRFRQ
jgi:hypothetical protein